MRLMRCWNVTDEANDTIEAAIGAAKRAYDEAGARLQETDLSRLQAAYWRRQRRNRGRRLARLIQQKRRGKGGHR